MSVEAVKSSNCESSTRLLLSEPGLTEIASPTLQLYGFHVSLLQEQKIDV